MPVDYETEYNNRARVPDHAQIFARWASDAAAYRERMQAEENAELGLAYGTGPRQTVDLFFPEATGHTPLALFVHGGYWRSLEASTFSHMAAGLNSHGIAVAVAGYDLCPQVTIGQIVNQIRTACLFLWRRFGQRLMVYGHSAGGHLSACMVATDWKKLDPKAPADLVPAGYSVSGLFDLGPLMHTAMNAELRLDEIEVARSLAHQLADHGGTCVRCRGGWGGVVRIPAPEPDHRRCLAAEGSRGALRRNAGREPLYRARSVERSGKRHDAALLGAGGEVRQSGKVTRVVCPVPAHTLYAVKPGTSDAAAPPRHAKA